MERFEKVSVSPNLGLLLDYWSGLCFGRRMPARTDIDPMDMPRHLLPNILLIQVFHDPLRFYYRLMGTAIADILGEDWTGKFSDEIQLAHENVRLQYIETVEKAAPTIYLNQYSKYDPSVGYERLLNYERVLLPLSDDDAVVHHLLGATLAKPAERP